MQRADQHVEVRLTVGQRPAGVRAGGLRGVQRPVAQPEDRDLLTPGDEGPPLPQRDLLDPADDDLGGRPVAGQFRPSLPLIDLPKVPVR